MARRGHRGGPLACEGSRPVGASSLSGHRLCQGTRRDIGMYCGYGGMVPRCSSPATKPSLAKARLAATFAGKVPRPTVVQPSSRQRASTARIITSETPEPRAMGSIHHEKIQPAGRPAPMRCSRLSRPTASAGSGFGPRSSVVLRATSQLAVVRRVRHASSGSPASPARPGPPKAVGASARARSLRVRRASHSS